MLIFALRMPKAPPISMMPPRAAPYESIKREKIVCVGEEIVCAQCKKGAQGFMVDLVCGHTFHFDCFETGRSVNGCCATCMLGSAAALPAAKVKMHWEAVFE